MDPTRPDPWVNRTRGQLCCERAFCALRTYLDSVSADIAGGVAGAGDTERVVELASERAQTATDWLVRRRRHEVTVVLLQWVITQREI